MAGRNGGARSGQHRQSKRQIRGCPFIAKPCSSAEELPLERQAKHKESGMTNPEKLKPMADILSKVRSATHTPASAGIVLFDYFLSQGPSIGAFNADANELEVPRMAKIKIEARKGPQARSCSHVCISVHGVNIICVDKCVYQ